MVEIIKFNNYIYSIDNDIKIFVNKTRGRSNCYETIKINLIYNVDNGKIESLVFNKEDFRPDFNIIYIQPIKLSDYFKNFTPTVFRKTITLIDNIYLRQEYYENCVNIFKSIRKIILIQLL